jgi:glycosyltransferase involved in cell wall biosynthesis
MFNIGLDARLSGIRHAGLGRYIANLALRLPLVLPPDYHLTYFFAHKTQWSELTAAYATLHLPATIKAQDIYQRITLVYAPIRHYSWAEQTQMPQVFTAAQLDLLHVPHFNLPYRASAPQVVLTIHDLLWHDRSGLATTTLPWWQYYPKYLAYRYLTNHAIKVAQRLIVPSHTIRRTLQQHYPRVSAKTQVIYNGAQKFTAQPIPPSVPLPKEFLLYVGSLYPHKNVNLVLQAMQAEPRINLVIASARDAFWQQTQKLVHQLHLSPRVVFLTQVPDATLAYLYRQASALVQPSLSEGFGLTGIEALQVGTKVIASDIPIFREIYGSAFFPFNPHNPNSLLAAWNQSQSNAERSYRLLANQQAAKFNWDETVQQVAAIYQDLLA